MIIKAIDDPEKCCDDPFVDENHRNISIVAKSFINKTDLHFVDITSEKYREYVFASGVIIRIDNPIKLHVSSTGGHRIFDGASMSHYIPKGWIQLRWFARSGQPHFVK